MKPFEFPKTGKNPATAATLSFFFIGLGQAYNGEIGKAALFLILYLLSIFLTLFIIGFVTIPLLWMWSMVDAYRSAKRIIQMGTGEKSASNASSADLMMNALVRDLEKA